MATSQYLAQALQQMSQPMSVPQGQTMDPSQMAALAQKGDAYRQTNPDGSFIGHNIMQAGRNLMAAPGNAAAGLMRLSQALPGMNPAMQQAQPFRPNGPMIGPPILPQ